MKINYTSEAGVTVEIEAGTSKEAFSQLATFQEVFNHSKCGKCGSTRLQFVVRTVDDNDYYEIRCMDCGAKLQFGANKVGGGLFPKRKNGVGDWLPDNGWVKWDKNLGKEV
jgi:DNA-directed RNA polymerase subunit RPC12/RpoP